MKAILVIDIEKDVDIETLRADFEIYGDIRVKPYYQFRKGVELKPMPQKKNSELAMWSEYYLECGYNKCIDEILGETGGEQNEERGV